MAARCPRWCSGLPRFGLPSIVAIAVTYVILKWTQRKALVEPLDAAVVVPQLSLAGLGAGWGIVLAALVLTGASALGVAAWLACLRGGILTLVGVAALKRSSPLAILTRDFVGCYSRWSRGCSCSLRDSSSLV